MAIKGVFSALAGLERDGIVKRYAIGGAIAALRYTDAAATEDVDVFVALQDSSAGSLASLGPIYAYLTARGARAEGAHLVIADWPVQFLPASDGLLAEALAEAEDVDIDGVGARFLRAEHLAAIALQVGRPKDKLRLAQMIQQNALDMHQFRDVLRRHGLDSKWKQFEATVLDTE